MKLYAMIVAAALVSVAATVSTNASDLDPIASSCTYEAGGIGDVHEWTYPAPGSGPVTGDDSVSLSACLWEFPDLFSPGFPGANFEGLGNPACKDIGAGVIPEGMACVEYGILVGGQYNRINVMILDAVWGQVGGAICSDNDNDFFCGDASKGETLVRFCGAGSATTTNDSDGNGHPDWGHAVAVLVDGPLHQGFIQDTIPDDVGDVGEGDCPMSPNPVGGTRGTILATFF